MRCLKMRNAKYVIGGILFFADIILLTGCGSDVRMGNDMRNVEERDYATIMVIEEKEEDYHFVLGLAQEKVVGEKSMVEEVSEWDAKNLEELAKDYGNVTGKDLSLAHLKIILLGQQPEEETEQEKNPRHKQFQRESWLEQLLYMLEGEDEIAKTCPMLELKEDQEFIDFLENEEEPVGNYLENLVRVKERQGVDVPWLKDYLKALRENEKMEVKYLLKVKEGWEISDK